ncbi:uncharacterized protein LOC135202969 [Macrobrachium nipponense]|uniref:uncharacterized protein LOC135202969 n=1 Tax=Macrobrachium nipponense TaxID=159736 RepID=UPI0030C83CA8
MFSVQIDATQDITSQDQCAVVLRYVIDVIHERLLAVVNGEATTGEYFVQILKNVLEKLELDVSNCIGNATDGASNIQGHYRGFSALLSSHSPNHGHVWCYAHVLNLVLAETTGAVIASTSLFKLLNGIAVFIRESYKRMIIWVNENESSRHQSLSPIGETRWWAKDNASRKIFGNFGKPDNALYTDVLLTVAIIQKHENMKSDVRSKAKAYTESLLKYETILTAQIFLRIFEQTNPLSKYLQTKRIVATTKESLDKINRDFGGIKVVADNFVCWANEQLEDEENADLELEVQTELPLKIVRKKKTMPGENAYDERLNDAERAYEVEVYNPILDKVTQSFSDQFPSHGTLYNDLSILDPRNFDQLKNSNVEEYESLFKELSKPLLKFDSRATAENWKME